MKKSLLTESEIRKFMKFANIGTLTENFIENTSAADTLEEEVVEETTQELEEAAHEDDKMEESVIEEETLEEEVEDPADVNRRPYQFLEAQKVLECSSENR